MFGRKKMQSVLVVRLRIKNKDTCLESLLWTRLLKPGVEERSGSTLAPSAAR